MKKRRCSFQNKLYLPIKLNNGKQEFMVDSHNKIKAYKSTSTLKMYAPGFDLIAVFSLNKIINKKQFPINTTENCL